MRFDIRAYGQPDEPLHPFDFGEIVLCDEETGRESGPLPPRRHYMAFVEILIIHSLVVRALHGEPYGTYTISSSWETLAFDCAAGTVAFRFEGLTATMELHKALLALRAAMERSLAMLAGYEDQEHSVILDLRDAINSGPALVG